MASVILSIWWVIGKQESILSFKSSPLPEHLPSKYDHGPEAAPAGRRRPECYEHQGLRPHPPHYLRHPDAVPLRSGQVLGHHRPARREAQRVVPSLPHADWS